MPALHATADCRRCRWYGAAGSDLPACCAPRSVVGWLGCADGNRHRVRTRHHRVMGARVPVELRIFLTAASIVDDIGAIIVVAIFYSGDLRVVYLVSAAAITALLGLMNRVGIYHAMPYVLRV